jgi:TRAP transporter 4TM/12TM fusion protein
MLIFYARFTYLFPVPFFGKGIPFDQLIIYLSFDSNGLLGVPLWVTGSIIFSFILFGEFLFATGGTQLINEFAMNTLGRFRGGPAKMAVVASGLFGTISGSAVANVMATGVITIPLMKRTGYRPAVAGAIEAAASTGGQLMPPIMGVAAFILAEFLSLPYSAVAIASIIPAILYYFAIFVQVDLEAAKHGLTGLADSSVNFWLIIKRSLLFFIPMAVLIYTLFILNFEPGKAAIIASVSCLLLSLRRKDKRIGLKRLLDILEKTGKGLLMIGATGAIAGLVIGVIYTTGLGTTLSTLLLKIGTQNLFLMLVVAAVLSIILGMGMPTGAVYIILAVVIAPTIVEMGVVPLAAHLFIFYFGLMSMVTPPVCFAAYAGAAIADADITQTGLHAVRFGMSAYIVAFLFVYSPTLLLMGGIPDILLSVAKSFVGIFFVAAALTDYLFGKLGWFKRILFTLGGLALLMPPGIGIPIGTWLLNVGGTVLCGALFFWERRKARFHLKLPESSAKVLDMPL